ncbi:MAG: class I SAM-dependent methyltransferase [Actinomycetes bacterium]
MEVLREELLETESISFSHFMEIALYDDAGGFFARGRGPSGRTDFVTSPETGSLFGLMVGKAIESLWLAQGSPADFVVIEAGAGSGRLGREILRGESAVGASMKYITVERSAALRQLQAETLRNYPDVEILAELPSAPISGVIIANELLDNLAFDIAEFTSDGWAEVRIALRGDSAIGDSPPEFVEVLAPLDEARALLVPDFPTQIGSRLPIQVGALNWISRAAECIETGWIVLIDYAGTAEDLARRGGWLRTYRDHSRGDDPLLYPGEADITSDVVLEPIRDALIASSFKIESETTQADWLSGLGIEDEVAAGEAAWLAGAARGDIEALIGRSRATEAAMLMDPSGLGGFTVIVARLG